MHVAIITDHGHVTGGTAKVAIESALGLSDRGHKVTFLAAVAPVDQRLIDAGIEVICLNQSDLAQSPLRGLTQGIWNRTARDAVSALAKRLPRGKSVIHVHGWAKALSPSLNSAIYESGHTAFYTLHDYFLFCPNGGFYNYPKGEICRLKPMSRECISENCDSRSYIFKIWRVVRQGIAEHIAQMPSGIPNLILISQLQQELVARYLNESVQIHRISNPISISDRGPKTAIGSDFIFVGRVSKEKGVGTFLEAARQAGARAVVVGDGPDLPFLKEQYPEVSFLGWLPGNAVEDCLREARALVFPSVWYEGQPLTVYEALALGTPVIVSDACAGREAVSHDVTGMWFKSGSSHELCKAIDALSDDQRAGEMSAAAYEGYWTHPLTPKKHLDELESAYETALRQQRSRIDLNRN